MPHRTTVTTKVATTAITIVPPELRGRQVAKLLVAEAFAFAREKGCKVIPTCSYVAKQAERNPEFGEMTVR